MRIKRYLKPLIKADFGKGKIIIIYGARQVGKTTLIKEILAEHHNTVYYNCDQAEVARLFEEQNLAQLSSLVSAYNIIAIDEAQRVNNIGLSLKLLVDTFPEKTFLVTGSSSLELAHKVTEPLTGRHFTHMLFPISLGEMRQTVDLATLLETLDDRLIYGSYPEIVSQSDRTERRRRIEEIANDYLFRDILALGAVRDIGILRRLLQAVALQIGSEVSTAELANLLGIDRKTVVRYLDVCEQAFILFSLSPDQVNRRNAIAKQKKYYFYDVGIRNALLANFNQLSLRSDAGALWENLQVIERMKYNAAKQKTPLYTFWRSYQGNEIDLIEAFDGERTAFEMKLTGTTANKKSREYFLAEMKGTKFSIINRSNFIDYI